MIDGKPFSSLSVNSVLSITSSPPGWVGWETEVTDLESVIRENPESKQDETRVMEAYLLTLMGFEIGRIKKLGYVVFGDDKYRINLYEHDKTKID